MEIKWQIKNEPKILKCLALAKQKIANIFYGSKAINFNYTFWYKEFCGTIIYC